MHQYITELLQIQNQLKIFHWQTKSFARHEAYGKTYDSLLDLIDEFVEVHMGKYGRFSLVNATIDLVDISDEAVKAFLGGSCNFLISLSTSLDQKNDSDLLNIRDEMLGTLNKLKYLLTLG